MHISWNFPYNSLDIISQEVLEKYFAEVAPAAGPSAEALRIKTVFADERERPLVMSGVGAEKKRAVPIFSTGAAGKPENARMPFGRRREDTVEQGAPRWIISIRLNLPYG